MTDHLRVIAIDGPAAAGKSTVARLLADRLGAMLFDTGVLYRVVAFMALRCGLSPHDAPGLAEVAQDVHVTILPPSKDDGRLYDVRIDGEDVTWAIRSPEVGAIVSRVSEHRKSGRRFCPCNGESRRATPWSWSGEISARSSFPTPASRSTLTRVPANALVAAFASR